jgi:hypothetical protein
MTNNNIIGKKAILTSTRGALMGFRAGQTVVISDYVGGSQPYRVKLFPTTGLHGYADIDQLDVIVDEPQASKIIGRKAILVSMAGISAGGFHVGDEVVIVHNPVSGNEGRIKFTSLDGRRWGYGNPSNVQVIKSQPKPQASNGIVKVEFQDFEVEGTVDDVLKVMEGLSKLAGVTA